jgi:hypothetical protein
LVPLVRHNCGKVWTSLDWATDVPTAISEAVEV